MLFGFIAFVFAGVGLAMLGVLLVATTFFTRMTVVEGFLFVIACFLMAAMVGIWRAVVLIFNQIQYQDYPSQLRPKK